MATFNVKVHALIDGSTWTDLSGDVLYQDRVNIRTGAGNQNSRIDAASCSFKLNNTSENYTPGNPQSTYYPNLGLGTKFRVSVEHGDVGLAMQEDVISSATTGDTAALDITGDIDVRVDASLWDWTHADVGGDIDNIELIGKFGLSPNKSWFFAVRDGYLYFEWSADGTNVLSATATELLRVPGSNPRMAVRVTMDVNNGAAGKTVTFYRADTMDGPWEPVGNAVTTAGTTSIANSNTSLRVGDASLQWFPSRLPMGVFHKAQVRNGIDGTVVANPDFTAQASGTTSFADSAGLTWTLTGGAEITNRKVRFVGEAASFTPGREDKHRKYVEVELGGIMRRLGANDEVLKSAVYRDMTSAARTNIIAYWPMEEGSEAQELSSPSPNTDPMALTGNVSPGAYSSWGASSPIPTYDTGFTWAAMPWYTVTTETSIRFFIAVPSGGVSANQQIVSIPTSGSAQIWRLILTTGGDLEMRAYDYTGTQIHTSGVQNFDLNGVQRMITLEFTEIGFVDTEYTIVSTTVDSITGSASSYNNTVAGYLFGRVGGVKLGGGGDLGGTAFGHLTVADDLGAYANSQGPLANWKTENSGNRVVRLADEEDIPLYMSGISETTYQGGQGESDILTLMQDVADTEYGMLGESRERLGLFYRSPDSLSSQKPVVSLTYTDGANAPIVSPFEPVYDDDEIVNDFTASRRDGGFTRYIETTGRLGTSDPPTGAGRYEGSDTYNVAYEYLTGDLASWAVHLGTFEGARFASLRVRLDKKTSLVSSLCKLYIGDIVEITGVPLDLAGTSKIKLRVEGYSEQIDQFEWVIDYVMSPGEPWDTGFAGYDNQAWQEEQFAWADTEGSELAEDLTNSETAVDVLTDASGPVWTSDAFDSPYDIKVGGEVMRVTAPGDLVNSNPLFSSNVTGWEAVGSTLAHETSILCPHPAAAGSLKITPDGVTAAPGARSAHTSVGTINPGGVYQTGGWFFSATASSDMRTVVDWYDSSDVLLSSTLGSASSLAASTWTYVSQSHTAPASASRAAVRVYRGGTPAASAVTYCWAVRITRAKAGAIFDSFGRTSTNTWDSSDSRHAWTNTGGAAADYDVLSGYGRHIETAANTPTHSVTASPHASFDVYCDMTTAAASTGASQHTSILARYSDTSNYYEARVEYTTANVINLSIRERVAGVDAQLGTYAFPTAHVAGTFRRVRFQGYGTSLKAKIWATTSEEPHGWNVEVTDASFSSAGSIGVKGIRATGNTNANADLRFDNFDLITPQTFTVERSVNSVVKTHSAAAAVELANPAIAGI